MGMENFRNISYMISHVFLMVFFYLFTVHRFSKRKTVGICIFVFFVLNFTDCYGYGIPNSYCTVYEYFFV